MGTIGDRLREERLRLGLSQAALGEKLGITSKTQVRYEAGDRSPDGEYLASIGALGADVLYVITGQHQCRGIGEETVWKAVLDAVTLLSLDKKVDAEQLARAVAMLAMREASSVPEKPQPQRFEGSMQVFHQAPRGDIAGRDINKEK